MLICPNGHGEWPATYRYCPECQAELIAMPVEQGDQVNIRSPKQTVVVNTAPATHAPAALVKCPQCGRKRLEAETFDCMGPCGRLNLCLKHFDEQYNVCDKCAATLRGTAAQEAARVAAMEAEVRAQAEALEKARVEAEVRTAALTKVEAEVRAKVQALAAAEAALAEWRPRAERAETSFAQTMGERDAAQAELGQVREKLAAAERAATEWQAKATALEASLAEWRSRAEKAEGQLAEIARPSLHAPAARQAELKRQQEEAEAAARRAAEAAKQQLAWQRIGIELVEIPAGEFLYGENKERVTLPKYYLAKTPVTNGQYKAFVDATGHRAPSHWPGGQIPVGKEQHPVVNVSWDDAQAFCAWAGLRLPGEQEWEKAARGTDGRTYPWGNAEPAEELCNFNENIKGTTPVGRYSPAGDSPYGLVDMAGNVWEWCTDWYDSGHRFRVLRGGSWYVGRRGVRAAARYRAGLDLGSVYLGFRCARSN